MRLLGIDLETTGLDTQKDAITEIGYVLIDTAYKKPLVCVSDLVDIGDTEVTKEIEDITHINNKMLDEFGQDSEYVLSKLIVHMVNADYIVAHNGNSFDKPFLYRWAEEQGAILPDKPWLDTKEDIQYPKHFRYTNLTYLAAEHGFINPFPHAALFDAMAMMKILSCYNLQEIIERHNMPWVTIRAVVDYSRREEAKTRGYQWQNIGDKVYPKCWVKRVKEAELEQELEECPFEIVVL